MPISEGSEPLALPGGNPAKLGPTNAPLTDVLARMTNQKMKRKKPPLNRRIAFAPKMHAFPTIGKLGP